MHSADTIIAAIAAPEKAKKLVKELHDLKVEADVAWAKVREGQAALDAARIQFEADRKELPDIADERAQLAAERAQLDRELADWKALKVNLRAQLVPAA